MHIRNLLYSLIGLMVLAIPSRGADLIRVLPVTDSILMLHFDEGHLDYQGYGQTRYNGITLYYNLLDLAAATQVSSYRLSSPGDPAYASPRAPLALGRKTKGAEFNNLYDPGEPSHLSDHFIYLVLPSPLQSGQSYTLEVGDLADNLDQYTFIYNPRRLRSPAVHVNQVGFTPGSRKYAYLSHWMGDFQYGPHSGGLELDAYSGVSFHVVDQSSGQVVFSGPITLRKEKATEESTNNEYGSPRNYSQADVWECDFSAFATPGSYVISVDRMGCSFPFEIKADIYREAYVMASQGLFNQRAGIVQEVEPGWIFERDYHPGNGTQTFYYDSATVTGRHQDIGSFDYSVPVTGIWGWYHDAGDWDHYSHHVRVPATLLHLYYLRAEAFADGDVRNRLKWDPDSSWVEEGQNGVPDLLDEAVWLVHFLRRARHALMAQGLGTGGVPGYVGRDGGFLELPSWKDTRNVAVTGEYPTSTYDYAGLAAYYAVCLGRWQALGGNIAQDTIAYWVAEGQAAYTWATQRGGGEAKSRRYAEAALFLATGDTAYQASFRANYNAITLPSWFGTQMHEFAHLLYAVIPRDFGGLDTAFQDQVRQDLTSTLEPQLIDYAEQQRGFRWASPQKNQVNILGTFSTPKALWPATAHHFTGGAKYLDAVRASCDYVLGGNEMDLVWLAGYGDQYEQSTFHLNSWYSRDYNHPVYRNPISPGLIPYGIHRDCDWQNGCAYNYVGDEDFSRSTAYPVASSWPQSECRFQNRHSIAGSEFTVHQTQVDAIFALGYLCAAPSSGAGRNAPPTLSLNLGAGLTVAPDTTLALSVQPSADMARVAYYYDWHYIGESRDTANGFALVWDLGQAHLSPGSTVQVTAVGYDDKGLISRPSPEGEAMLSLASSTAVAQPATRGRLLVHPNPAADSMILLNLEGYAGHRAAVHLLDLQGKVLYRETRRIGSAYEPIRLRLTLPAGMYIVKVSVAGEVLQARIQLE